MNLRPLLDLADSWRSEAELLRSYGAEQAAEAAERHAEEVEEAVERSRQERLRIKRAAEESGYSEDHLRRLIRDGTIPNAGDDHRPRVRRRDLPRKPGHRARVEGTADGGVGSRTQVARSVVESD